MADDVGNQLHRSIKAGYLSMVEDCIYLYQAITREFPRLGERGHRGREPRENRANPEHILHIEGPARRNGGQDVTAARGAPGM